MFAALLLIAAPGCADPAFCPTLAEFRAAIGRMQDALDGPVIASIQAEHPGDIVSVDIAWRAVENIKRFKCRKPAGEPPSAMCSYWQGPFFVTVRLTRDSSPGSGWRAAQLSRLRRR